MSIMLLKQNAGKASWGLKTEICTGEAVGWALPHMPLTQSRETQSLLTAHELPPGQSLQVPPPQSTAVSALSIIPLVQVGST
jgi:hypothetical protein